MIQSVVTEGDYNKSEQYMCVCVCIHMKITWTILQPLLYQQAQDWH